MSVTCFQSPVRLVSGPDAAVQAGLESARFWHRAMVVAGRGRGGR